MNTDRKTKPPWKLTAADSGGKRVEAGRFETEFLAMEYAVAYGLQDWKIDGPQKSLLSPETVLT